MVRAQDDTVQVRQAQQAKLQQQSVDDQQQGGGGTVDEVAKTYAPMYEHEVGVARALYSNASEYPDELAFTRGATLRVIHDPDGPELSPGWWLCVDESTGDKGIVPANRLEIMAHFDQRFFQVANPLFDDFFMFSGRGGAENGGATAGPFDRRRRMFPGFPGFDDFPGLDRGLSGSLNGLSAPFDSMRRGSNATDDGSFRGIVRNIPIKVEQRESAPLPTIPTRSPASMGGGGVLGRPEAFSAPSGRPEYGMRPEPATFTSLYNSGPPPQNIRRTVSSGQLSPTPSDPLTTTASTTTLPTLQTAPNGLRGQSSLNGGRTTSFADFPSQRKIKDQDQQLNGGGGEFVSPVERLAQRLRNLASRNGQSEIVVPITVVPDAPNQRSPNQRSPSPSSSGIVADMEGVAGAEENKRSSDLSSLSDGGNSSFERHSTSSASSDDKAMQHHPSPHEEEDRHPPPPAPSMSYPKPAPPPSSSTTALQSVFDSIERPKNLRPLPRKDEFLPSSIAEDMRRNESGQWKTIPTRVSQPSNGAGQRTLSSISESEMSGRKRALLTKMTECLRMIERSMERLRGATAPQFWREPHVLQKNLPDIRDSVTTINEALDHFVDSTARIAIDNVSTKADELRALLVPLRDSRALIGALRQALDLGGWTLATLARDKRQPKIGLDSIEQFLIVVKRVPQECVAMLDWLSLLNPDPPVVCFMATAPSTLPASSGGPLAYFGYAPSPPAARVATTAAPSPAPSDDSKRLSSSSTTSSTVTSGDSSTSPPSSILKQPNGASKGGARVTFADDVDSSSRSNRLSTSSLDGTSPSSRLSQLPHHLSSSNDRHFSSPPGTSTPTVTGNGYGNGTTNGYGNGNGHHQSMLNGATHSSILEEDDLESVLSERDSLYQDYAQLDDPAPHRLNKAPVSNGSSRRGDISDEDRQLIRFYAPQLAGHTDALALAIDEFIDVVEHQLPPREFVQKGKLIILAAHKLIYIGDSVSQCVKDAKLSVEVRAGADHLCNLLKECVSATKSAAEEYPNITHVQRMVDTIVAVSRAATDLKLLVETHI